MLTSFLLAGIFIAISSNNWLIIWIGLELNLYSFIPFILQTSNHLEKEAALKYFLAQATASIILLTAALFSNTSPIIPILIIISLTIKLGIAPCHFWFPSVINASPWPTCWLLTTIQKIAPLVLISFLFFSINIILILTLASLRALVGANGAFNQSHLRPLLAYSSIHHIGWIIAALPFSTTISTLYFISYIFISSSLIYFLHKLNFNQLTPSNICTHSRPSSLSIILNLLSLGGQPPFLGFFPKIIIIYILTNNSIILLATILISTSAISLYFYIKIIIHSLFSSPTTRFPSLFNFNKPSLFIFIITLSTAFSSIILSLIIFSSL